VADKQRVLNMVSVIMGMELHEIAWYGLCA